MCSTFVYLSCKHVSMRINGRTRAPCSASAFTALSYCLETGSLTETETLQSLLPVEDYNERHHTWSFYMGSGHPNLSLHVSTTAFYQLSHLLSPKYRLAKALFFFCNID